MSVIWMPFSGGFGCCFTQPVAITTLVSDMPAYTHFNTATPSLYSYSTGFKASYLRLFKDQLRSLNLFNHAYKSLI